MENIFSLAQVLDLLISMDQCLNPEIYPESKSFDLEPKDFVDAAICNADKLGIRKEFEELRNKVLTAK